MPEITLDVWTTPDDYGGYDPVGHYGVLAHHRDSDAITRSNWEVAKKRLAEAANIDFVPTLNGCDPDNTPPVYKWKAMHWAVGWVEYLMVRPDAPEAVLEAAQEIKDDLAQYPVLDDDHWSSLEYSETMAYWTSLNVRERAMMIRDSRSMDSLFAARRDTFPEDPSGLLYDYMRS